MLKKIALTLVSTLVSLLIIELILRLCFPVYTVSSVKAYQYDPELGVRLRPGIHILETTDFQQEVRVNHLGSVNFQDNFDGYRSLVFAVGDSYTQGTGLPSDMSYPAQLDLLLNTDSSGGYEKRFGVVNLGLAAYGGEQNLLALKRYSALLGRPSVILYLGCGNDYEDDQLFKSGYRHNHIVEGSPKWGWLVGPLQWLTNDLQIGLRIKLIVGQLRRSSAGETATPDSSEANRASVAEMEAAVLERLREFARESGSMLIVSWAEPGDSYEWIKSWAGRNQVAFADWVPRANSVKSAIPEMPLDNPHSGGHHRGWVNRIIAEEYGRSILLMNR